MSYQEQPVLHWYLKISLERNVFFVETKNLHTIGDILGVGTEFPPAAVGFLAVGVCVQKSPFPFLVGQGFPQRAFPTCFDEVSVLCSLVKGQYYFCGACRTRLRMPTCAPAGPPCTSFTVANRMHKLFADSFDTAGFC